MSSTTAGSLLRMTGFPPGPADPSPQVVGVDGIEPTVQVHEGGSGAS
ncbi:hypothetical protein [Pseudarthrobacter sp. YAF2]